MGTRGHLERTAVAELLLQHPVAAAIVQFEVHRLFAGLSGDPAAVLNAADTTVQPRDRRRGTRASVAACPGSSRTGRLPAGRCQHAGLPLGFRCPCGPHEPRITECAGTAGRLPLPDRGVPIEDQGASGSSAEPWREAISRSPVAIPGRSSRRSSMTGGFVRIALPKLFLWSDPARIQEYPEAVSRAKPRARLLACGARARGLRHCRDDAVQGGRSSR